MADASRSNGCPSVVRASHPSPTITFCSPGASLVRETLPPLLRLIATRSLHSSVRGDPRRSSPNLRLVPNPSVRDPSAEDFARPLSLRPGTRRFAALRCRTAQVASDVAQPVEESWPVVLHPRGPAGPARSSSRRWASPRSWRAGPDFRPRRGLAAARRAVGRHAAERDRRRTAEAGDAGRTVDGLLADADADAAIAAAPPSSALAALAAVEVKGRAPAAGTTATCSARAGWTSTATAATPATTSSRAT